MRLHKGYLKNTVVVILGDHLSMQAPLEETLGKSAHRTIFNRFAAPANLEKNRDNIYHFDIFPSTLYAMGFRFDKNRLGLGASGFGTLEPNFTISTLDELEFHDLIAKKSEKYLRFWNPKESNAAQN